MDPQYNYVWAKWVCFGLCLKHDNIGALATIRNPAPISMCGLLCLGRAQAYMCGLCPHIDVWPFYVGPHIMFLRVNGGEWGKASFSPQEGKIGFLCVGKAHT